MDKESKKLKYDELEKLQFATNQHGVKLLQLNFSDTHF